MSLINEALQRAEREKRDGSAPGGAPGSSLGQPAGANEPEPPGRKQTGLRAAVFLGVLMIAAVAVVMYFSLPPEPTGPAQAQGERPATAPAQDRQAEVKRVRFAPRPRPATAAESSVNNALATLADYRPPQTPKAKPAPLASPLGPASAQPKPQPAAAPPRERQPDALDPRDFKLGGILQSGDEAHAIVNDHLVSVGDDIDGATVVEIGRYHVVLAQDDKRLKIRL